MKCPHCKEELPIFTKQFIVENKPDYYNDGRNFVKYTCKLCWETFLIR